MKYFIAEMNKTWIHAPQIINWFQAIDESALTKEEQYKIPYRTTLNIRPDKEVEFVDILSFPLFLVSKDMFQIMNKFEPNLLKKEVILCDQKNKNVCIYYLPILDEVDCLTDGTRFNMDKSQLEDAVINEDLIRDKSIFTLSGVKKKYVVMRLDLVEAVLRREARGLKLQEIKVVNHDEI